MGVLPQAVYPLFLAFFFVAAPLKETSPATVLWTAPAILLAALMIAWAAESAQYFVAQGFALAMLAWLQTLPEFAVEAVLAWHQQTHLLLANLTGALRLLTGTGWPLIYFTAAWFHRRRTGQPLRRITLEEHHSVEVMGLLAALLYIPVIAIKNSLTVYDGAVLIAIYAAYLWILGKLPSEDHETIEDLEIIPRTIVKSRRSRRIFAIGALFVAGGALIYFSAKPFLASLLALSVLAGVPDFVFVQWIAPLVSEFPEMLSTLYWARRSDRAPMALMNMVSSNINQWTLLAAMLPIVYSMSMGAVTPITFDVKQEMELWLTLGQAVIALVFLINMELVWWEAASLAVLFALPFFDSAMEPSITWIYFGWAAVELVRMFLGRRKPQAFPLFAKMWRGHVRGSGEGDLA
jgi:cation:H+ antiporter